MRAGLYVRCTICSRVGVSTAINIGGPVVALCEDHLKAERSRLSHEQQAHVPEIPSRSGRIGPDHEQAALRAEYERQQQGGRP